MYGHDVTHQGFFGFFQCLIKRFALALLFKRTNPFREIRFFLFEHFLAQFGLRKLLHRFHVSKRASDFFLDFLQGERDL